VILPTSYPVSAPLFPTAEDALDLSRGDKPSPGSIDPASGDAYLRSLATLLRAGIVGVETRAVNGRPVERFITTAIGDESLRGLPPYRGPWPNRLDIRA
jgi:hypothetical protein